MKERHKGIILLLPALLVMALFTVYPMVRGVTMSFTNANIMRKTNDFVGLENYARMLTDEVFWISLRQSVSLTVIVVLLQLVFGLILASAMTQKLPGMGVYKSIIMASWVIPVAATVTMFKFMAQPDIGLINILLRDLGVEGMNKYWFGEPQVAFTFIILLHLWRNVPFYGVAFLAAMQAIPKDYYEAAQLDGANAMQRFFAITLPGIRSMIVVMVTIHVLWTFNNFDFVYLSTGGGPVNRTDVLPVYVYRKSWTSYTVGYAASMGVIMLILLMIYFVVYTRLFERQETNR
ncbi:MAG: sugar ABC transporter permease [Chloroflexota bacterium]|jgi:multiple sugar transport system permease protein|nr:sugar ABC transporter permease [Chloroflexota bacterium]